MDLFENPFHVLGAAQTDDRRRIAGLADERSLVLDPELCRQTAADLNNPRKRLSAEIAWLPGMEQRSVEFCLSFLESAPSRVLAFNPTPPPLARANLYASALLHLPGSRADEVACWITSISGQFERINLNAVVADINKQRAVSGHPQVTDLQAVEGEIKERREYYRKVFKSALNNLYPRELVEAVTSVIQPAISSGVGVQALILDLVDAYDTESREFFQAAHANINDQISRILAAIDDGKDEDRLSPLVDKLERTLGTWHSVAKPIQLAAKCRHQLHGDSFDQYNLVRDLSFDILKAYQSTSLVKRLISRMKIIFGTIGTIADQLKIDLDDIEKLEPILRKVKEEIEKLTYSMDVGTFFDEVIHISPKGILYKNRLWPIDSITRIRCGGYYTYNIGEYVEKFTILIGTVSEYEIIKFGNKEKLESFKPYLIKNVAPQLIDNIKRIVSNNNSKYVLGSTWFDNYGIMLCNYYEKPYQWLYCRWKQINISRDSVFLYVEYKFNTNYMAKFLYGDIDNLTIFEIIVMNIISNNIEKISDTFKQAK